ncbi:DNA repair protein-like protein Rad7 [Camillea tinctor]|nr:DNA repair protein-like protein Rad7 [Camillea tinctor]
MANCEVCEKRFTVTPYSRAGPNGGLLCPKCSKEAAKDEDANKKKKKRPNAIPGGSRSRRGVHSRILDGTYQTGAKPLMTLCIETLAKNIDLADDLGDLPPPLIDRISRLLSKRRLLDGRTLDLFLQPDAEDLKVYDAARLSSDDYIRIFQRLSQLKTLKLRNAIQFRDNVMSYLISRHITLNSIYLHGANLLTEDCWNGFLKAKGQDLKTLQVYFTDRHFSDNVVKSLNENCPSLARLKICHNQQVSDEGIKHIAHLENLEHLSLRLVKRTSTDAYVEVIKSIGSHLRTFSIQEVEDVDDRLLDALHDNCTSLTKLRITASQVVTDAGFVRLFKDWKNKPLNFIDLEQCRHVDAKNPRENAHQVGLCSDGFQAIMNHSGKALRHLNVHACRHISREAFEEAFSIDKEYPELLNLEISFCEEVTDLIVGCIFRSCPNLKKLNVFGCMKVKHVRVPRGKILVGLPNAMGMVIEGKDD